MSWSDMYGDAMIAADRKKFGPVYSGLQMLHIVAHVPGDGLVEAASNTSTLVAYATKRRDGLVGLILANEDPKNVVKVKVNVSGGPVGAKGRRFDYGAVQENAGTTAVMSDFKDAGSTFTLTVPSYSITDVLMAP